jgi:hypothetical protein
LPAHLPDGLSDETHRPAEDKRLAKTINRRNMKKIIIMPSHLTD